MRNKSLILIIIMGILTACDVHQWPKTPESVQLHLRLNYETSITKWEHRYNDNRVIEEGYGETYNNHLDYGKIRYIIRTYPVQENVRAISDYTQEFVFTKDISEGYNHNVTLDLLPGNYNVMVWSDLVQASEDNTFYEATNFAEITLQGDHSGNNDYRDAFRGSGNISLVSSYIENLPDTLNITMQRPLAKFEFITNDVKEFIDKESTRIASKAQENNSSSANDNSTKAVNLEDYKIMFYYVGFMPHAYSMNTDKPVDSTTGVMFESTLRKLTESDAVMGFDYVFVNGQEATVTIQIGICDNEGTQLSLTDPIDVPLKRSHHTVLTGMFLMSKASGGVTINPGFNGDFNLIIP